MVIQWNLAILTLKIVATSDSHMLRHTHVPRPIISLPRVAGLNYICLSDNEVGLKSLASLIEMIDLSIRLHMRHELKVAGLKLSWTNIIIMPNTLYMYFSHFSKKHS